MRALSGMLRAAMVAGFVGVMGASAGLAGTCEAQVVGVKSLTQYNHAAGSGFLAVRSGPGSDFSQIGEVYLGDWSIVFGKRGNWYRIGCYEGRCTNPLWGEPSPEGWAYGKYLSVGGVCDHLN